MKSTLHRSKSDIASVAAIGVLSHILADALHEAIGHGGAALASGSKIIVLSSVFFRSEPGSRFVDGAGPTANLIAGLLLLGFSRRARSGTTGFFLVLTAAFNLFWCAGYFLFSGATNQGDWALVVRGWPAPFLWRALLFLIGIGLYIVSIRQTVRGLARLSDQPSMPENGWRLVLAAYFAAGFIACLAALFDRFDTADAVGGAIREGFLANAVLLIIPRWLSRTSNNAPVIPRDPRWVFAASVAVIIFVLTLGCGFR